MYELQVSVFSHEINVLTDLGPEVGIGSNREVLFDGKTMLLSECDIILYIWERSFCFIIFSFFFFQAEDGIRDLSL